MLPGRRSRESGETTELGGELGDRFLERELRELSAERGGGLPQNLSVGRSGMLGRPLGRFRGFRAFSRPENPAKSPSEPLSGHFPAPADL